MGVRGNVPMRSPVASTAPPQHTLPLQLANTNITQVSFFLPMERKSPWTPDPSINQLRCHLVVEQRVRRSSLQQHGLALTFPS
jgi:hypothetical protein